MMDIKARAEQLNDVVIGHRRWFHQHPELSFEERETTGYIVKELERLGIEVTAFHDYHGAIGTIKGSRPGKTVMLRADIDALPTTELTGLPFASKYEGRMHACGHDCHAAMLLTAAQMLAENKNELNGTVKLLFQSAEESCFGAKYYIDKGCLDDVDAVFGFHVWGSIRAPYMNFQEGYRMASCDNFKITVHGCAAHGSAPHLSNDAIVAACSIILNLQTFVSRRNDPLNPLVITVGTIKAGTQFNIIADTVTMDGTVRTFSPTIRTEVEPGIRRIIENIAAALGCTATLEYDSIEDPVINSDPLLIDIACGAVKKLYGNDCLREMEPTASSEDFSMLMTKAPGVFGFLGCLNPERNIDAPNHSDHFNVDESILHRGSALYTQIAVDYLSREGKS